MDSVITNFMKMGHSEEKVRRALELANNDFAKTLEYLVNGLPEPSNPSKQQTPTESQPKQSITNTNINTTDNIIDDIDDIYGYSDDEPQHNNTQINNNDIITETTNNIQPTPSNTQETITSYCECSAQLQQKTTTDAFIYCDGCNKLMQKGDIIYTCPKGTDSLQHRSGYDLCLSCAKNNKSMPSKSKSQQIKTNTQINNNINESQNQMNDSNYSQLNGYNNMTMVKSNTKKYYEWEWSSHGGSRWNKYDSNTNDILNSKLSVGKTIQMQIRGNMYNITRFDDTTAIQKNPQTNKTRNVRRVEKQQNYEMESEAALQRIIEILGCRYSEAQYAFNKCNKNEEAAINYILEKQNGNMNDNNYGQMPQQPMQQMQQMQQLMQMGMGGMGGNSFGMGGNNNMNMQQNDNNFASIFNNNCNDMNNNVNNNIFGVNNNSKDDSDIDDIYGYSDDDDDAKKDSVKESGKETGGDMEMNAVKDAQSEAAKAAINRYNENASVNVSGDVNNKKDSVGDIDDIYGYSDDEKDDNNKKNEVIEKGNNNVIDDIDDIYGYSDDEQQQQVVNNDNNGNKKELNKQEMHGNDDEIIYFNDNDKGNVNDKNIEMVVKNDDNGSDIDDIYGYSDDNNNDKAAEITV